MYCGTSFSQHKSNPKSMEESTLLTVAACLLVKFLHTNSFPAFSVFLRMGSGSVCFSFIRYLASPVQSPPVSTRTFCFQVTNSMENMPHYPGGTFFPLSGRAFRQFSLSFLIHINFLLFLSCTLFYYTSSYQGILYNKPV